MNTNELFLVYALLLGGIINSLVLAFPPQRFSHLLLSLLKSIVVAVIIATGGILLGIQPLITAGISFFCYAFLLLFFLGSHIFPSTNERKMYVLIPLTIYTIISFSPDVKDFAWFMMLFFGVPFTFMPFAMFYSKNNLPSSHKVVLYLVFLVFSILLFFNLNNTSSQQLLSLQGPIQFLNAIIIGFASFYVVIQIVLICFVLFGIFIPSKEKSNKSLSSEVIKDKFTNYQLPWKVAISYLCLSFAIFVANSYFHLIQPIWLINTILILDEALSLRKPEKLPQENNGGNL